MVDRIVPATSDADLAEVLAMTGLFDAWPVVTEPFSQWVVEDVFPSGRPDLAAAGVAFVADVKHFEDMKLRMLNCAHSTLAYAGQFLGLETVADAMNRPELVERVGHVMVQAGAMLPFPAAQVKAYAANLQSRFRNPALRHRTAQIAMDGSQNIPQQLLNSIRDARSRDLPWDALAFGVASWILYLRCFRADDPMSKRFARIASDATDSVNHARAILGIREVFGYLSQGSWFRNGVIEVIRHVEGFYGSLS